MLYNMLYNKQYMNTKPYYRLPIVGRPYLQRNEARRQRDEAQLERDRARKERDKAQGELTAALEERDEARRERDEAREELDAFRARFQPRFRAEHIGGNFAFGWVFADSAPITRVVAKRDQQVIAETSSFLTRLDIAASFPESKCAKQSGFELFFDPPKTKGLSKVRIYAEQDGVELLIGEGLTADPLVFEQEMDECHYEGQNAYPAGIAKASYVIDGKTSPSIEHVCAILRIYDLRAVGPISDYIRYLTSCWSHFQFVDSAFPTANKNSEPGKKDFYCRANSPFEMISIAHHLYVLRSYGVNGAFAEFGCFKGFSSSMLSYACSLLGIKMHVYDSFEGLPSSMSEEYEKGEFTGSLDEVLKNITQFGAIDSVVFHKGFFSDSLRKEMPPPLACLWMDVDLDSSARDALVAAKMLSPLGAIFSHECLATDFSGIAPRSSAEGPNDVIPAIISFYNGEASAPHGLFIHGHTGAFWRSGEGIPVLPPNELRRVLDVLQREPRY